MTPLEAESLSGRNLPPNAKDTGEPGLIPKSGDLLEEEIWQPTLVLISTWEIP